MSPAELRTTFSGIQASTVSKAKRGLGSVTFDPAPVTFAEELALNETVLFSDDGFTATLESGDLSISVSVGGSLTYNVLKSELGKSLCLVCSTPPVQQLTMSRGSCSVP